MKVILMKELVGKGVPGDVVDVAAGFANNYLIPQGFAKPCTKANLIKHAADAAWDGREAEPAKRACIAVVENASGMRGESPAFADKGSLVVWAIEALCDPERWQWFGEEGDALRIVAAEGDGAGGPAASEDHAPRRREEVPACGCDEAVKHLGRLKAVELPRSLRIAGRACARMARSFR